MKRALLALVLLTASAARAAEPAAALTLEDSLNQAVLHSKGIQIAKLRVDEASAGLDAARRLRYPQVEASALSAYFFRPLEIKVSQGSMTSTLDQASTSLGMGPLSPLVGQFPSRDLTIVEGSRMPILGALTVKQPLSQLWKIGTGIRAASATRTEAEREALRTTAQIRFAVEELYVGSLLEKLRLEERQARIAFEEGRLRDAENAQRVGESLDDVVLGLRASVIEAKTELTRSEQQLARLSLQLGDLIGRPGEEHLELAAALPERPEHPLAYWLERAALNPDRQIAAATLEKARAGVRAARQAHIPELSLFASGFAQDGAPLLPSNSGAVGVSLTWDIFDFGRRSADTAKARARERAAAVNEERLQEEAARQIRLVYQDFTYAGELTSLAGQAVSYRRRAAELARQSVENGLALAPKAAESETALRKAEADLAAARYQRHLSLLRLYYLVGEL